MSAHDDLLSIADDYWDSVLEASPMFATLIGDRRFDDRIDDLSLGAEQRLRSTWGSMAQRLGSVDRSELDEHDTVTAALLEAELTRGLAGLDARLVEMASDQMDGVHAGWLTAAPQINAPDPTSAARLLERHRQIATMLDQALDRFRAGLESGRTPARTVIDRSLNQLDGYLASDLSTDPFVTIAGPDDWAGEAQWRSDLSDVARDVIRPAFARYRQMLADTLAPAARPDDRCGLGWLGDDGEAIYRTLLAQHTTLDDLGADEIHEIGLAEIERLQGEYATIGGRRFNTSDLAVIFERMRTEPELRYADEAQIMSDAQGFLAAADAEMGNWFGRLPVESCKIEAVPEFLAADAPAAYYFPPASDGSRPGTYFVNTHDPTERYRTEAAAVAFHEAIPGHHLQLTIANELDHLPRFQALSFSNTAFVEGWALYTERLAEEMGLYRNDVDRLGMLAADSWRSCRLVVDTGLHAKGWSRQQAIDFMAANAPVPLEEIKVEIDRYIAIPGQAVSYKVGQLEIQRLRAAAGASPDFDIKAFHDTVLGSGSVSLPVLRQLVGAIR